MRSVVAAAAAQIQAPSDITGNEVNWVKRGNGSKGDRPAVCSANYSSLMVACLFQTTADLFSCNENQSSDTKKWFDYGSESYIWQRKCQELLRFVSCQSLFHPCAKQVRTVLYVVRILCVIPRIPNAALPALKFTFRTPILLQQVPDNNLWWVLFRLSPISRHKGDENERNSRRNVRYVRTLLESLKYLS